MRARKPLLCTLLTSSARSTPPDPPGKEAPGKALSISHISHSYPRLGHGALRLPSANPAPSLGSTLSVPRRPRRCDAHWPHQTASVLSGNAYSRAINGLGSTQRPWSSWWWSWSPVSHHSNRVARSGSHTRVCHGESWTHAPAGASGKRRKTRETPQGEPVRRVNHDFSGEALATNIPGEKG